MDSKSAPTTVGEERNTFQTLMFSTVITLLGIIIAALTIAIVRWRMEEKRRWKNDAESTRSIQNSPIQLEFQTPSIQTGSTRLLFTIPGGRVKRAEYHDFFKNGIAESENQFRLQFEHLGEISDGNCQIEGLSQNEARKSENNSKNRFVDTLPYDSHRIQLQKTAEEDSDYINASAVYAVTIASDGSVSMNFSQIEYICTQAPMVNTCGDFWRMICEQNITIVVMLTKLVEKNQPASARYWPEALNECCFFTSGAREFCVTWKEHMEHTDYTERVFGIFSDADPKKEHLVRQVQFNSWPDLGVPNMDNFKSFLQAYRKIKENELNGTRTLVHCRAGIGRTGTFVAADIVMRNLSKRIEEIDVPGIILQLRRCRICMVQTLAQYVFLHQFVDDLIQAQQTTE